MVMERDIKKIVHEMTLEEKADMCSGADSFHLKGMEKYGIPQILVSDASHGLCKPENEEDTKELVAKSITAVCFPTASAAACSFDRGMMSEYGRTMGRECQAEGVDILLGPGVNMKRSPLGGRNFEYYSEDPYLTGELASEYIQGIQKEGVGVCAKHFAVNNQEHRRMTVSAELDERTLHGLYLKAFERIVKKSAPVSVMCAYNRINGIYASENRELLYEILREKWGYEGFVISDWGAVNDRVEGIRAGLDLEMPYTNDSSTRQIIGAVESGTLSEEALDTVVERVLRGIFWCADHRKPDAVYDQEADHKKARDFAAQSMVLLKNEDEILPLQEGKRIAVIGEFAEKTRYQGGGEKAGSSREKEMGNSFGASEEAMQSMMMNAPLRFLSQMSKELPSEKLDALIDAMNQAM